MIKKITGIFLLLFYVTSCQGVKEEVLNTSLTVKTDNEEASSLKFLYFSQSSSIPYFTEQIGEDGVFRLDSIEITEPILGEMSCFSDGRHRLNRFSCYIEPGANVEITRNGLDVTYSGDLVKENQFLKEANSKAFLTHFNGLRLEGNSGFETLDNQIQEELAVVEKSDFGQKFKTYLKEWTTYRFEAIKYNLIDKLDQSEWTPEMLSFIKETASEKFESPALLGSMNWFYYLDTYFRVQNKAAGKDNVFASNLEKVSNALTKERYILYNYDKSVNARKGLDGTARKEITSLAKYITTKQGKIDYDKIVEKLGILEQNYAHLMPGQEAPKFTFEDVNGNMVALEDFKGKYVFVDVWNIYCGPCIKQIPYLKKYEEELKNENIEFIGVSCDKQEEKDKWRDFVAKKEMVGHQLIMDNGRHSKFLADYQIIGFPTFIVIDPEGKMVSYRFLMPENKNFMPTLRGVLKG